MKLENLWLYAFDLSVKNGNSHNAVKIANEAVDSYSALFMPQENTETEEAKVQAAFEELIQSVKNDGVQPETEEVFYWKDVEQFVKDDAEISSDGDFLQKNSKGIIQRGSYVYMDSVKYLARKPKAVEVVTAKFEWLQSDPNKNQWECFVFGLNVIELNGSFCFEYKSKNSHPFPTLQDAQKEAERYYDLYIPSSEK